MAIPAGTRLGPYEILSAIGAGGMGEVYRARDTRLQRDVAIKVLPEAFVHDTQRMARFEREARLLASLNHPNIAAIHGLEESGRIRALVMELVEGPTLADRIRSGALPLDEALPIARQIAEALEYAHDHNVIHRDLKPANIKITPDGAVKVLDFGLAKAMSEDLSEDDMANSPTLSMAATRQGVILGTAAYMSPEQARGKTADRRADIWAFGAVLYEMLTGQQAFKGEDLSLTLAAVMKSEPDWNRLPESLSPTLRKVLYCCLRKDSKQRLQAIGDARLAMEGAFDVPTSAQAAASPTGWRRAAVLGLMALLVGGATAGFTVWRWMRPVPLPASRWLVTPSIGESFSNQTGTDLAISPDGTSIVYVADRDGSRQLYLRSIDQLEARAIPGTEGAIAPFFSPDGQWVAFGARPEAKLKKVSLQGGPAVTICDVPDLRNASWGTDGNIVFASGFTEGGVFRVSAAGGQPELLAKPDVEQGEQAYRWPEVLPGGRAVLFTVLTGGAIEEAQVAVLSLDTGERKILVRGGSNPLYAATGHIIYGQVGTLMAVPFDLGRLEVTGTPFPLQEGVLTKGAGAANFALSRNGSLIYQPGGGETGAGFDGTLVWVDRKGRAVANIVDKSVQRPRQMRLSPDARHLALTIGSASAGAIWVYDLQGRPPTPLTLERNNFNPVWTPDGARIAFASDRTGWTLFWMPADGSNMNPEALGNPSPSPKFPDAWTPDGQELIYEEIQPGTRSDIMALPKGQREPKEVVATGYNEGVAALSPDGRWLAYVSDVTGRSEVWVRAYPGGGAPVRISPSGGTEPVWSRDDRELFYLQGNKMMAVPVQTGADFRFQPAVELFDEPYTHGNAPSYDVAPDGRFVMVQPVTSSQVPGVTGIVVVRNWFEELKRRVPAGTK